MFLVLMQMKSRNPGDRHFYYRFVVHLLLLLLLLRDDDDDDDGIMHCSSVYVCSPYSCFWINDNAMCVG